MEGYRKDKDTELLLIHSNTLQPIYKQYGQCIVNEPGWQIEDDIMNMTYCHTKDVVPVYRKINTNVQNINTEKLKQIYDIASILVSNVQDYNINNLINHLDNSGISEDAMNKYAQQKINDDASKCIPIVFCLLKRYNIERQQTGHAEISNKLTNVFGIPTIPKCLAYIKLKEYLIKVVNSKYSGNMIMLSHCLYHSEILFTDYFPIHFFDISEFYYHAYQLLINNGTRLDVYNALQLSKTVSNLKNMGYMILNFEPITIKHKLLNYVDNQFICQDTKNRIALFLHLVAQYDLTKGILITPTSKQFCVYKCYIKLNILPPDSFDKKVFDDQIYAFAEFKKLINNIKTLMLSDNVEVQQWVNHLY